MDQKECFVDFSFGAKGIESNDSDVKAEKLNRNPNRKIQSNADVIQVVLQIVECQLYGRKRNWESRKSREDT